jgi:antitoxin MazE
MLLELTKIGNSRGIRIPKPLIEQCGFTDAVEARLTSDGLVLAPAHIPRKGWKRAFMESGSDHDTLQLDHAMNEFDTEEWSW